MSETGSTGNAAAIVKGQRTPDIVRDEAFRLWLSYGRSWVAAARVLDCDEKTLRRWGKEGGWEQRRQLELQAALPGMRLESDVAGILAEHDARIRLQQIAHDAAHHGVKADHREVDALVKIVSIAPTTHALPTTTDTPASALDNLSPQEVIEYYRRKEQRKPTH
jgi:hypothetical protein